MQNWRQPCSPSTWSRLRTCGSEKVPSLPALMLLLLWEILLIKLRLFSKRQPLSGMRVPPLSSGNQTLRAWSCRFGVRGLAHWACYLCLSPSTSWLTGSAWTAGLCSAMVQGRSYCEHSSGSWCPSTQGWKLTATARATAPHL